MNIVDIYCATSPSGKKYVGQAVQVLCNGKKWGHLSRWKTHINEAINFKECSIALDNAIRKYENGKLFTIELIVSVDKGEADCWENHWIIELNSMTPNGYNMMAGRSFKQSQEIIEKRRVSMMGKNLGKVHPRRERLRPEDVDLPKYLRSYRDSRGRRGFRISNHPDKTKNKAFFDKITPVEDLLEKAMSHLNLDQNS